MTRQNKQHTVIFSGGGTSGHIHPAIAIAQRLQGLEPSARILFCGTPHGLEHEIVPRAGFEFEPIRASGFPRRLNRALVRAVQDYGAGRRRAMELIREYRPDAVVGTGGYVCGPLLSAAARLGVPRLIHEQNAFPGRSNRLMSRGAAVVCISYEGTRPYFGGADKVVLTGNPVRSVFSELDRAAARTKLGLDPERKLILATGGSLGARRINEEELPV